MDYSSNAKKNRGDDQPVEEVKEEKKVITGGVKERPKGVGSRFRNLFLGFDPKAAAEHLWADVTLPAIRQMAWETWKAAGSSLIYNDDGQRGNRTTGPRIFGTTGTYNATTAYNRVPLRDDPTVINVSSRIPDQPRPYRSRTQSVKDLVFDRRGDAEEVVEMMFDTLSKYECVSKADVYEKVGLPTTPIDNKWGWTDLVNLQIRQMSDGGFLLILPPAEVISN